MAVLPRKIADLGARSNNSDPYTNAKWYFLQKTQKCPTLKCYSETNRVCHWILKYVLWTSLRLILYKILWIFRIWSLIWPRRSHIRAHPQSFLRIFEVLKSVKVWLQNKPFGFWGFWHKFFFIFLTFLQVTDPNEWLIELQAILSAQLVPSDLKF